MFKQVSRLSVAIIVIIVMFLLLTSTAYATQGDFYAKDTLYQAATYGGHPNYFGSSSANYVVDINANAGDTNRPVYAPEGGTVAQVTSGYGGGWGNSIIWTSADGREKIHVGHLNQAVKTGSVDGGNLIAYSGNTGNTSKDGPDVGAHLHISRKYDGVIVPVVLSGHQIVPSYVYNGTQYVSSGPISIPTDIHSPRAALDFTESNQPGTVWVRGWAFDPDAPPAQTIDVHIYIGGPAGTAGAEGFVRTANDYRHDVGSAFGIGDNHGYDVTLVTSKRGTQSVYVYAINAPGTPGGNVLIGSGTVGIGDPNPLGSLDLVASNHPGTVRVGGWNFDPNVPKQPIDIHIYIGGPSAISGAEGFVRTANGYRTDVKDVHPGVGDNHGYDVTLNTYKRGAQSVYVYAINAPGTPGEHVLLGSGTVNISDPPPPDIVPPTASLSAPRLSTDVTKQTRFKISWSGKDPSPSSGIASYDVQYKRAGKSWVNLLTNTNKRATNFKGRPGYTYYFRARSRDNAGNVGKYTRAKRTIVPHDNNQLIKSRSGFGRTNKSSKSRYYRNTIRYSTRAGDAIVYRFTGRRLFLISTKAKSRSKARIYINGKYIKTINAYSAKNRFRQVVFKKAWRKRRVRTLRIVNVGNRRKFDVDGLGVVR